MTAYIVAQVEITDPEAYEAYRQEAAQTIAAHGGSYVVRGGHLQVLEGTSKPRLVVIRFPSLEQARHWYDSDAYAGPKALRHRAALSDVVLVEGVDAGK